MNSLDFLAELFQTEVAVGEEPRGVALVPAAGGAFVDRRIELGERVRRESPKQVTAPVWHAGPAGTTRASTASPSQSAARLTTRCVLPLVAPLCQRPRDRD